MESFSDKEPPGGETGGYSCWFMRAGPSTMPETRVLLPGQRLSCGKVGMEHRPCAEPGAAVRLAFVVPCADD